MTNPCDKCKRINCPEVCYPKRDYLKALQKQERRGYERDRQAVFEHTR